MLHQNLIVSDHSGSIQYKVVESLCYVILKICLTLLLSNLYRDSSLVKQVSPKRAA